MIMLLFVKKTTSKSFVKEWEMQKHWYISGGFFQEARIDRFAPKVEMGDLWCVWSVTDSVCTLLIYFAEVQV